MIILSAKSKKTGVVQKIGYNEDKESVDMLWARWLEMTAPDSGWRKVEMLRLPGCTVKDWEQWKRGDTNK